MQRSLMILGCTAALSVMLAVPAPSLAGGPWTVKDASGRTVGKVRTVSATKALVLVHGKAAGEVNRTARGKWTAFGFLTGHMEAIHIWHAAQWGGRPGWQLRGFAELGPLPLAGRLVKRDGQWLVQSGDRERGWSLRGLTSGACPAWAAGGAVFLCDPIGF